MYLAISQAAISSALIHEESKVQRLVYYISQAFQDAKNEVPMDGEDGLFLDRRFEKTPSIFLSSHLHGNDRSANLKSHEQTRCSRAYGLVGG